jgi:hypothetical protein
VNNKRGFGEARELEMHVLGELLGWRRGWLAGACGWNERSESRAKGARGQSKNRKNSANERRREQRSAWMLLLLRVLCVKARDESRTR